MQKYLTAHLKRVDEVVQDGMVGVVKEEEIKEEEIKSESLN